MDRHWLIFSPAYNNCSLASSAPKYLWRQFQDRPRGHVSFAQAHDQAIEMACVTSQQRAKSIAQVIAELIRDKGKIRECLERRHNR
jgi:hypothetical protein